MRLLFAALAAAARRARRAAAHGGRGLLAARFETRATPALGDHGHAACWCSSAVAMWLVGPRELGRPRPRALPDPRSIRAVLRVRHLRGRRASRRFSPAATCPNTARARRVLPADPFLRGRRDGPRRRATCSSLFLGLETMSLGVYAMIGFRRTSRRRTEAAIKYFLLGSFAAGAPPLRRRAALRRDRPHRPRGHRPRSRGGGGQDCRTGLLAAHDLLADARSCRPGVQGQRGAVPHVDARRVRGRAHARHDLHGRRRKDRGVRVLLRVLLVAFGDPSSASWGTGWPPVLAGLAVAHDDRRQPHAGGKSRSSACSRTLASRTPATCSSAWPPCPSDGDEAEGSGPVLPARLHGLDRARVRRAHPVRQPGREAVSYEDLAGVGKRHPLPRSRSPSSSCRSRAFRRPPASSASSTSSAPPSWAAAASIGSRSSAC